VNDVIRQGIGMTSKRTRDRLIARLREQGVRDEAVLEVMAETPRHLFIDEALSHKAYEDTALPIGFNQTISQPYIVAKMTELLLAQGARDRVLEVGTGSGYQTAVLALLCQQVFSVERILPLQQRAAERLSLLQLNNVELYHTDGGMGLPMKGPFDAIMVTAAPETVPEELKQQLAIGGVMVIPVGGDEQRLMRIERRSQTGFDTQIVESVRFVPLLQGTVHQ
jgi:protein-L-isoaspartate(D-aspartate) O-methyltransferase